MYEVNFSGRASYHMLTVTNHFYYHIRSEVPLYIQIPFTHLHKQWQLQMSYHYAQCTSYSQIIYRIITSTLQNGEQQYR